MSASVPRLLVVGGNGFLGSAICRLAVGKGWDVSSMSSSGKPYATPAGHTPAWAPRVKWHAASAFSPDSYSTLIGESTAVVHTLGILLEDVGYKQSVKSGDVFGLVKSFASSLSGGDGNPLKSEEERKRGYEGMNKDSALTVLDTLISTTPPTSTQTRPFVYISAADAFRPVVPRRYIETKRQAEIEIMRKCDEHPEAGVRPTFIRPGLMYHPHIRPLTTLPAFLVDLSAKLSTASGLPNPFASKSPLHGALESLRTYPLHVDHVAAAVLKCIEEGRGGVVEVPEMRDWAGLGSKKKAEVGLQGQ
ncbi:hypothetical protein CI109_106800 [Kwoniella shandongensis]|uniref:Uncharacterized protein n=1 Tax=Kwoniella shandongensis TaxID=1734106 RepID=A0A5M6C6V8_9TREE|nr:uncharacterized protein CI109_000943 [Kwoniella shandongensis]KAA5530763.1 hypothetical protein CI109_000943 [Kwoniella shandongensis]